MKLLYFASVRQKIGFGDEEFPLPDGIHTIAELIDALRARNGGYAAAFSDTARIRAALNQVHVAFDSQVRDQDEVAFFPPVTGG